MRFIDTKRPLEIENCNSISTLVSASTLSLYDVLRQFNLRQVEEEHFAPEWSTDLPEV